MSKGIAFLISPSFAQCRSTDSSTFTSVRVKRHYSELTCCHEGTQGNHCFADVIHCWHYKVSRFLFSKRKCLNTCLSQLTFRESRFLLRLDGKARCENVVHQVFCSSTVNRKSAVSTGKPRSVKKMTRNLEKDSKSLSLNMNDFYYLFTSFINMQ